MILEIKNKISNNCVIQFLAWPVKEEVFQQTLKHNNLAACPEWDKSQRKQIAKEKNVAVFSNHIIGGNVALFL